MRPFVLEPGQVDAGMVGTIICEEVRGRGKRLFTKGHVVTADDLPLLAGLERSIHAVRLDPNDVHENVAGGALAQAVNGGGLAVNGPVQSRYNLVAETKGLLRVSKDRVDRMNAQPGVAIFTLPDRLPVVPGKIVAGAKTTPVAVPQSVLDAALAIAAKGPVVQVKPFLPMAVGVVVSEGLDERVRERFRTTVERKIGWYGSSVAGISFVANEPAAIAAGIERYEAEGVGLVLTAGGNTIDPLDAAILALAEVGAERLAFGAPAHPGSMFWLAAKGDLPIFNLASCSMYSKATVADLILPWVMAGERVGAADVAALGYGGLLDRDMGWRFPAYDVETVTETDDE